MGSTKGFTSTIPRLKSEAGEIELFGSTWSAFAKVRTESGPYFWTEKYLGTYDERHDAILAVEEAHREWIEQLERGATC